MSCVCVYHKKETYTSIVYLPYVWRQLPALILPLENEGKITRRQVLSIYTQKISELCSPPMYMWGKLSMLR